MCDDHTTFSIYLKDITPEDRETLTRLSNEVIAEQDATFYEVELGLGRFDPADNIYVVDDQSANENPDVAADFIQRFLKERRPDQVVVFEVAYTCSKGRPGHMGGAAYFVTADTQEAFGTSEWIAEKIKNIPAVQQADEKI